MIAIIMSQAILVISFIMLILDAMMRLTGTRDGCIPGLIAPFRTYLIVDNTASSMDGEAIGTESEVAWQIMSRSITYQFIRPTCTSPITSVPL